MYYLTAYAYMFTELYCNMKSDMLIFQTCPPEMVNEIDEDFMRWVPYTYKLSFHTSGYSGLEFGKLNDTLG